jgi:type I restriction enzyme S subunit
MDSLINDEGTKLLGQYIKQLDERNTNLEVTNLLGISIEKKFFPSNTNQINLELKGYKIVRNNQFSFVTVTSRNGGKISMGLLNGPDGIVSSTYIVFDVINKDILLPEFLLLWFKRAEFDRYARFHSWGSARETFNWDDMCNVKLPIPDIKVQESIVAIHNSLESRKRINAQLKDMSAQLSPILTKGASDNILRNMGAN